MWLISHSIAVLYWISNWCFFFNEVIKVRCSTHWFLHYISFRAHLYPKLLQPWRPGGDTGDSEWEWKGTKILIAKWSRTSAKGVRADVVTVSVTVCLRLEEHVGLGELGSWGTLECKPVACACVVQLLPLPLPHAEPQLVDWLMRPQWRWWRALSPTGTTSFRLEFVWKLLRYISPSDGHTVENEK